MFESIYVRIHLCSDQFMFESISIRLWLDWDSSACILACIYELDLVTLWCILIGIEVELFVQLA
jgi:hypothetical protein